MRTQASSGGAKNGGFTLVEILIASALLGTVLLGAYGIVARDRALAQTTLSIGAAESRAQTMLHAIESELVDARGAAPRAQLTAALGESDISAVHVDTTLGFPDQGWLVVERGTERVERIRYGELAADSSHFDGLARGEQCTDGRSHASGVEVLWAGLAEPIAIQTSPAPDLYDGRAIIGGQALFFRGDGTGFSYRVPTDPSGGTNYLVEGDIRWGSTVGGEPLATGWSALWFEPAWILSEAQCDADLNRDGDVQDLFDVGQIKRRAWDTSDPDRPVREIAMGPTVVLQERCNWGGDLDHDGFDDPLFLWDSTQRRLHVRVFVIGLSSGNNPLVRCVETEVFLRNEAEN